MADMPIVSIIDHQPLLGPMTGDAKPRIRVAELFAGVGGFRLGLEGDEFEFVFSNQYEPSETKQWASKIYEERFGSDGHSGKSIHEFTFPIAGIADIPDHELLVGGFPCQDYSVARTVSGELGIKGEKGKLWVDISRIIRWKRPRPKAILLENVPRLLNSPANARGLNFAVILDDLIKMGYDVEWRVINASDYGMPQQRSRVFILAYRRPTPKNFYINGPERFGPILRSDKSMKRWLTGYGEKGNIGPFAKAFPIEPIEVGNRKKLPKLDEHNWSGKKSEFGKSGYAWQDNRHNRWYFSFQPTPLYSGHRQTLGEFLVENHDSYYEITDEDKLRMYAYIKGEQKEWRIRKTDRKDAEGIDAGDENLWDLYQRCTKGYDTQLWADSRDNPGYEEGVRMGIIYDYTAGAMAYPDPLDKPSRTVVTSEIGKSVSRMRHVIEYEKGKFRGLMPVELERLNQFPDNWTDYQGISDSKRGFLMGNALVVGIIERLAGPLANLIHSRGEDG